jgi:hypothetical protein
MITKTDAIISLLPEASFVVRDNGIEWRDKVQTQPTEAEIQAEMTRLQAEYDNKQYQRDRKEEYPTIEECVHAILDGELDDLQIKRQVVKDKYPKGDN